MAYYGYDPSKYMTDFSYYGKEIGSTLSGMASTFTELAEHNKLVHENNNYKELAYSSVNQYIDQLDDDTVSNIVSSWGMPNVVEQGIDKAREAMKARIPRYTDKIDPKEYSKQLATDFFVPFQLAAESPAGGGVKSFGELYKPLMGSVTSAIGETATGQSLIQREQEQRTYDTGIERKSQEESDAYRQKYGKEMPETGTYQDESQIQLDQKLAADKAISEQTYETEQDRKLAEDAKLNEQVNNVMNNVRTPEDVWTTPFDSVSSEAKDKAYTILRNKEQNDLRLQLKEMDSTLSKLRSSEKPVSSDEFDRLISTQDRIMGGLITKLDNLEKNKDKYSNKERHKQALMNVKSEMKELELRRKISEKAKMDFLKSGKFTTAGFNEAMRDAEFPVRQQRAQTEQEFINAYNNGEYRKFWDSRKGERQNFVDAYVEEFGREPSIPEIEKAVPQFGAENLPKGKTLSPPAIDKSKAYKVPKGSNGEGVPDGLIEYNGKYYIKKGKTLKEVK